MPVLWILAGAALGLSLGLVGAGGSVLAVPALVYLADLTAKEATTTSLVIVGTAAALGSLPHARRSHVDWRSAAIIALIAVPGSWAGTAANRAVDETVLLVLFGGAMIAAAINMWRPPALADGHEPPSGAARLLRMALVGVVVGLMTGFFGIGGGFIIVPLLVLGVRLPMHLAVGTSLAVIAAASFISFGFHIESGGFAARTAAFFLAGAAAGAIAGGRMSERLDDRTLRRVFAAILVPLAGWVIIDAVLLS